MFQQLFQGSDLMIWPLVGLVIFLTAFAGVLLYVIVGLRDRRKVDRLASLPFEDEAPRASGEEGGRA